MAESEYVLTQAGKKQLEEELAYLEGEKRAEVGERIRVAREFGDISENSEYDDAKNEQAMVETRIAEINRILSEALIVDAPVDDDRIHIGQLVENFQTNGTLTGDYHFVIEGMDKSSACFLLQFNGFVMCIVISTLYKTYLRTITFCSLNFRDRCGIGHTYQ